MLDHRLALGVKDLDTDNIFRGFSQGQALSKIWRAHKKKHHLNEIAKLGTPREKEQYAKKNGGSYSDDLLQELSARRSAQAKTRAEIDKINAEASSKNADANEKNYGIGVKRVKDARTLLRGIAKAYDFSTNEGFKKGFIALNRSVGMMTTLGMIPPEKAKSVLMLYRNDPRGALEEIKTYAADDPDYIKALTPKTNTIDTGGQMIVGNTNPLTGEWSQQGSFKKTIDPTQQANFDSRERAQNYTADKNYEGRVYGANATRDASVYRTNTNADIQIEKMNAQKLADWADGHNGKPMPVQAVKEINRLSEEIQSIDSTNGLIEESIINLQSGKLDLGLFNNAGHTIRNATGYTSQQSVNFERLKSNIHKMANQVMMDAKGVQTEGDAKRAYDTIIASSLKSEELVINALEDLKEINKRTKQAKQRGIQSITANYGRSNQPSYQATTTPPTSNTPTGKVMSRKRAVKLYEIHAKGSDVTFPQYIEALRKEGVTVQ